MVIWSRIRIGNWLNDSKRNNYEKILWICSALLAMVSCQEDYELNTDFAVPTELSSPASIQLNVSSPTPVVLSWSGGGAADGGIVLYEVLFDKADGDFQSRWLR